MLILQQLAEALEAEPYSLLESKHLDQQKDVQEKPPCPVRNVSGSIYYLLALAKRSLHEAGEDAKINEMMEKIDKIYNTRKGEQVLEIILEYVELYDMEEYDEQQYHVQQM